MALVLLGTSLGSFTFDAVLREDHESRTKITEFPVHTGADVTDHAYIEPRRVTLEIGASDVMLGDGESARVFEKLLEIQAAREPMDLTTHLHYYPSMMIESITSPRDYQTAYGLKATVVLREIIRVDAMGVAVSGGYTRKKKSKKPYVTDTVNRGEVQTEKAPTGLRSMGIQQDYSKR